jgi:Tubulin-tyrosine ligase family
MDIELPPYEDIYDFNEQELNKYYTLITKALETKEALTEKWQRKAQKIIELIEIELEERISVNQISNFCNKELNSDLYQQITEELPANTQEIPSNTEISTSDVSEKMWNMRKNKKNYKEFVKNTLKNTQQSTDLKIGGSSVPINRVYKPEDKPKSYTKDKTQVKRDSTRPLDSKTTAVKNLEKTFPAKKTAKIEKNNKVDDKSKPLNAVNKDQVKNKKNEEKKNHDKNLLGTAQTIVSGSKSLSVAKELKSCADPDSEPVKQYIKENVSEVVIEAITNNYKGSDSEEIKNSLCKDFDTGNVPETVASVQSMLSRELSTEALSKSQLDDIKIQKDLKPSPGSHILHQDSLDSSPNPLSQDTIHKSFKEPLSQNTDPVAEYPNLETSDLETEASKALENSVSNTNPLKPYDQEASISIVSNSKAEAKQTHSEINNKNNDKSETISKYSDIVSNTSDKILEKSNSCSDESIDNIDSQDNLDIYDKNHTDLYIPTSNYPTRKNNLSIEAYEPDLDSLSQLKALKDKIKQQPLTKTESKPNLAKKPSLDPSKPLQKNPSQSKIVAKPTPKLKIKQIRSEEIVDYSGVYNSFFEIFSGYKTDKEFSPLIALRDVYSMFKEFLVLLESPEFDVHRKFKLNLAPLEINPRDLVRGDEMIMSLPSDKEMYYRVVKARPEVYDIVSRGFNKKKGWSELPHGMNLRLSWNVMWTWSKPSVDMSKLLVWQKVNHFPETKNFSRKDLLKKNIEKIMKISLKCGQLWNIIPVTYVLPKEYVQFVDHYSKLEEQDPGTNVWIMKPVGKSRGRGISVINDVNQVSYGEIMIIQRYITNPLLLEGFKFDLRLYILITSFSPLEAFIYKEGFARISTVPFSLNPDKLHNKFIHLTNSSIQKHNPNSKNDSLDALLGGTKICLKTLKERLQKMGINWEKIWQQVIEIVLKSLIAVQSEIPSYPCCFDLVGYDVMIDQNLQSWLVEINSSPSLARENYLDDLIKQQLIDDTLDLIDPTYFNKIELLKVMERRISEVQKGHINNSVTQMNADFSRILERKIPRKYGETPSKIGAFEMISPSGLYDKLYKIANPRN